MSDPQPPASMSELVRRIVTQLQAAADAASAAQACAAAGDTDRALALLRDIEPKLYELTTLLNAASMLRGRHTS